MTPPPRSNEPLPDNQKRPHPDRLSPSAPHYEAICDRHEAAMGAGQSLYEDPTTGLWVMTAAALWGRACCNNGCRHCPHMERP